MLLLLCPSVLLLHFISSWPSAFATGCGSGAPAAAPLAEALTALFCCVPTEAMVVQQTACISGSRAAPAAAATRQQRRRVGSMQARRQTTRCAASIQFAKYQGLGNDFILVRLLKFIGFKTC